jgi:hypothetical protein
VATLTAAQLARKRANDREAQRAIRQRTKEHIESLERRIAELTTGDENGSRLDEALQRNLDLEKEVQLLRDRFNNVNFESHSSTHGKPRDRDSIYRFSADFLKAAGLDSGIASDQASPESQVPSTAFGHGSTVGTPGMAFNHASSAASFQTPISTVFLRNELGDQQFGQTQTRNDTHRQNSTGDADLRMFPPISWCEKRILMSGREKLGCAEHHKPFK